MKSSWPDTPFKNLGLRGKIHSNERLLKVKTMGTAALGRLDTFLLFTLYLPYPELASNILCFFLPKLRPRFSHASIILPRQGVFLPYLQVLLTCLHAIPVLWSFVYISCVFLAWWKRAGRDGVPARRDTRVCRTFVYLFIYLMWLFSRFSMWLSLTSEQKYIHRCLLPLFRIKISASGTQYI